MSSQNPSNPPPGCSEEWLPVNGLRVRFWHSGSGPALVLVHGLLGYSFSWRYVIPALSRNAEIFAPDLPGGGLCEGYPGMDCRLSSATDWLLAFLDAAGITSCDLVGHSYGGTTAMRLAASAPGRVRRLVLVSPANPWSHFGRLRIALLQNAFVARVFPPLARPLRRGHDFFLRRLYGNPNLLTREVFEAYSTPMRKKGILEHGIKIVRNWNSDMRELAGILPQISKIPTLLVWGSKDRAVDPASAVPLSRNFMTVRIAEIEGAGHLPFEERPDEFISIVTDFLASPSPGTQAPHVK